MEVLTLEQEPANPDQESAWADMEARTRELEAVSPDQESAWADKEAWTREQEPVRAELRPWQAAPEAGGLSRGRGAVPVDFQPRPIRPRTVANGPDNPSRGPGAISVDVDRATGCSD